MKKILFVVLFGILLGVISYIYLDQKKSVQAVKEPVVAATATPTPEIPVSTTEVHSADGEMKIFMKKTGTIPATFDFYVTGDGLDNTLVYSKTLTDSYFTIPANSWSPDNKYFFIKENDSTSSSYFLFKEKGDSFIDGSSYIDISEIFSKKLINYSLKDVTGWDAPGLLHVLTSGPSFWFDIGSEAFLQLVTR